MAGAVVSISSGAVVTVAGAVVNNISGSANDIEFPVYESLRQITVNTFQIVDTKGPDIPKKIVKMPNLMQ